MIRKTIPNSSISFIHYFYFQLKIILSRIVYRQDAFCTVNSLAQVELLQFHERLLSSDNTSGIFFMVYVKPPIHGISDALLMLF
jgi:hypothetical protein